MQAMANLEIHDQRFHPVVDKAGHQVEDLFAEFLERYLDDSYDLPADLAGDPDFQVPNGLRCCLTLYSWCYYLLV